jgi:hypothetical protein
MARRRGIGFAGLLIVWSAMALGGAPAEAAKWDKAYINALPDEAFASVEARPDGTQARHLPHHDAQGRVDLPHLRSALSRLHQVKWADPANAGPARDHLLQHYKELGLPVPGASRGGQRVGPRSGLHVQGASLVAGAAHPRAPRQATSSPASAAKQPAKARR